MAKRGPKKGYRQTPEHRAHLSEAMRNSEAAKREAERKRDDPVWHLRLRESHQKSEKLKAHLAMIHADPDIQRRRAQTRSNQFRADPRLGVELGEKIRASPAHRAGIERRSTNQEWLRSQRERAERMNSDPEIIRRRDEAIAKRSQNTEWLEGQRRLLRQMNADPEIRRKQIRCQNPSKDELKLGTMLPGEFIHTGQDANHAVLNYLPDYQWPSKMLIVEYDGYWKHRDGGEGSAKELKRDANLVRAGWRVLHVGPKELKDPEALRARIAAFVAGQEVVAP